MNKLKQKLISDWQLFLANYWHGRKVLYTPADNHWQKESFPFYLIWLILVGTTLFFAPFPGDDLPRHLQAWQYNFNYRQMFDDYPYAFNLWYGFDLAAGELNKIFGNFSVNIIQAISIGLISLAIYLNLKGVHTDTKIFILLILIWFVGDRFLLARPTMFETALLFIAIGLTNYSFKPIVDKLIHLCIGFLMISFYHLFFIYLLPLLIWRRIYLIPLVIGFIGWYFFTAGEHLIAVKEILAYGDLRIPGIEITENASSLILLLPLITFLILFLNHIQSQEKKMLLAGSWFVLPMQMRYLFDNIIPMIAFLLAKQWQIKPHPFINIFMLLVAVGVLSSGSYYFNKKDKDIIYFAQNERVLTHNLNISFWAIHHGANQKITVAPAMEIGYSNPKIQEFVLNREISCELMEEFKFDKLVESSAIGLPLSCLELEIATKNGYKIWKYKP